MTAVLPSGESSTPPTPTNFLNVSIVKRCYAVAPRGVSAATIVAPARSRKRRGSLGMAQIFSRTPTHASRLNYLSTELHSPP